MTSILTVNADGTAKQKSSITTLPKITPTPELSQLLAVGQSSLESFRATGFILFLNMARDALDEIYSSAKGQ